jgi:hypothetical protein
MPKNPENISKLKHFTINLNYLFVNELFNIYYQFNIKKKKIRNDVYKLRIISSHTSAVIKMSHPILETTLQF